jgi:hypothetical protein
VKCFYYFCGLAVVGGGEHSGTSDINVTLSPLQRNFAFLKSGKIFQNIQSSRMNHVSNALMLFWFEKERVCCPGANCCFFLADLSYRIRKKSRVEGRVHDTYGGGVIMNFGSFRIGTVVVSNSIFRNSMLKFCKEYFCIPWVIKVAMILTSN